MGPSVVVVVVSGLTRRETLGVGAVLPGRVALVGVAALVTVVGLLVVVVPAVAAEVVVLAAEGDGVVGTGCAFDPLHPAHPSMAAVNASVESDRRMLPPTLSRPIEA